MPKDNRIKLLLCIAVLISATIAAFEPIRFNDFVNYDDYEYITENNWVTKGFSLPSIKWAFTTGYAGNWHPLTWLSHMLDCQLFGLNPLYHHLENLSIHIINCLLMFWFLKKLSKEFWLSLLAAVIFAVHPLRVESVVWAAERKDLLCGMFWLLTSIAYIFYTEKKCVLRYLLMIVFFILALMSKPMAVTLPFALLLLDFWPLKRLNKKSVIEKIPLIALVVISCIVTFLIQQYGGAMNYAKDSTFSVRILNAAASYGGYLADFVYPSNLAVLYPHPGPTLAIWKPIATLIFIMAVTAVSIWQLRKRPCIAAGWFWYMGTLVPVIGIVQVGAQAMADRYTYIPSMGFSFLIIWLFKDIFIKQNSFKKLLFAVAAIVSITLILLTRQQVERWRDSETLFSYTLSVTNNNFIMHNCYARALRKNGKAEKSVEEVEKSISINPNYFEAYNNYGMTLDVLGRFDEAIVQFKKCLALSPEYSKAYNNLGIVYAKKGDVDNAIINFKKAIEVNPYSVNAYSNLGFALFSKGDIAGAIINYKKAIEFRPDDVQTLISLSMILSSYYDDKYRDGNEAIILATMACEFTGYGNPVAIDALASAYAELKQFDKARELCLRAMEVCRNTGDSNFLKQLEQKMTLYKESKPYRIGR